VTHIQGFLIAVKTARRDNYLKMARDTAPMFAEFGALRTVECWADDVADGQRTDMKRATKAQADESIVFSWIEWPDKATCDAAAKRMMTDERMQTPPEDMPFDGARMIYAGFETVHDSGGTARFGYVDGVIAKVTGGGAAAVAAFEAAATPVFKDKGATRLVGGVSSEIKRGKTTDFLRAVDAQEGDMVTFGWIEWPDKATRDAGMGSMRQDERMTTLTPAWDGPTAIFGGFVPILDSANG
jgi:uncharacterized protein YbaA (DUF1428 family)